MLSAGSREGGLVSRKDEGRAQGKCGGVEESEEMFLEFRHLKVFLEQMLSPFLKSVWKIQELIVKNQTMYRQNQECLLPVCVFLYLQCLS